MPTATLSPFEQYATNVMELRYSHVVEGRKESWGNITKRVVYHVVHNKVPTDIYDAIFEAIYQRKLIPGGRILSQAGRAYHQTDNCFTLQAEDTREGWAELAYKTTMMFMSGGGVGVDYSLLRPYGSVLKKSGGISSGPLPCIEMVNSIAAAARQGGERRGACYASLAWDHADIGEFIKLKNGNDRLQHTNISVRFDKQWQEKYPKAYYFNNDDKINSRVPYDVFHKTLQHACQWGDPGFQFDSDNQILRNACSEIISADDCDSCCLASVNFANIDSLTELADVTNLGILFLLCNTMYTNVPYGKVREVKDKNRRLGLGIMGLGEWFIQRQMPYGCTLSYGAPTSDPFTFQEDGIGNWLQTYQQNSDNAALHWSNKLSVAKPIATRAIAPTGTISIVGGHTTPGIEPVFHTAYQRTYNTLKTQQHSNGYKTETVIDPIVQKWVENGYDVRDIDTAYTLSQTPDGIERRIAFQAFCQRYVDNAISSTVNLPQYKEGIEDTIAPILLRYLPQLRGITFYPDGRHHNQPVVPIDIGDALAMQAQVMASESCKGDSCGL